MAQLRFKRGTRAQLNTAAAAAGLRQGEPYFITDEDRIAVGLSTTTYETFARETVWNTAVSTDITLAVNTAYVINATGGTRTEGLPASMAADDYLIVSARGGSVVITVPSGKSIVGTNGTVTSSDTLTLLDGETVWLVAYSTTQWRIV
jgi:hypothetical protein